MEEVATGVWGGEERLGLPSWGDITAKTIQLCLNSKGLARTSDEDQKTCALYYARASYAVGDQKETAPEVVMWKNPQQQSREKPVRRVKKEKDLVLAFAQNRSG